MVPRAKMARRLFTMFLSLGVVLAICKVDYTYGALRNELAYENFSHRENLAITQIPYFEKFDTWPNPVSLNIDGLALDALTVDANATVYDSRQQKDELMIEWVTAISTGLFSTAVSLALMSARFIEVF